MNTEELAREKSLYLYISGLERGDFDQMQAILEQAQTDPVLEQMINETHEVYIAEMPEMSEAGMAKAHGIVAKALEGNNE